MQEIKLTVIFVVLGFAISLLHLLGLDKASGCDFLDIGYVVILGNKDSTNCPH